MYTPLEIEIPIEADLARRLLNELADSDRPQKARRIHLDAPLTDPVQVWIVQPGERSPSDAVSLKCSMDLSGLVARRGFTTNVIRKFIPTLADLGIARLRSRVTQETRERINQQSSQEDVRVTRVSGTFLFDFKTESAALDALYRIHKHLKVRLDCASRYPAGRQPKSPQAPRVVSEPNSRHEFTAELVHYPHRDSFGQARFSVARDAADLPYGLGIESAGARSELSARLRQLLRIDVTVDAGKPLPLDDGAFVSVPTNARELAEMKRNLLEDMWTSFRWAAWINDDFVNDTAQLDDIDLKPTVKELLDLYLGGEDLMKHYLIQGKSEELLRFRKLMLREAKVDVLVPWAAASHCEARWLRPRLEYGNRLNVSEDPQLAPYSLSPPNADLVVSDLLAKFRGTGSPSPNAQP